MFTWQSNNDVHTVLIISENIGMISVWERLFEQKNCFVVHEHSPRKALQSAIELSPALIVLDLDLPQLTRLELCRKLRTTTRGTLLLLTPSNDSKFVFEYIRAGVNEQIPTPISPMALVVKSMAWLARQEWVMPV